MHQLLKPLYPLPGFSDQVGGRECETEETPTEAFYTLKSLSTSNLHLDPVRSTASSGGRQDADWRPESKAVREMPGMCVSTSAAGTPDCCTPPYRTCLCSNRRRFSCRKSGGFQEIGISAGSAGKHFATWGWGSICDHWSSWKLLRFHAQRPFLCKVTSSPAVYIRGLKNGGVKKQRKKRCITYCSKRRGKETKGKEGFMSLKSQSVPQVLGTKLTMARKEQSHLKASPLGFGSSVVRGKIHSLKAMLLPVFQGTAPSACERIRQLSQKGTLGM